MISILLLAGIEMYFVLRVHKAGEREQRVFMRVTHLNVLTWAWMYGTRSDLAFSNLFGRSKSTLRFTRMQMRVEVHFEYRSRSEENGRQEA